MFVSSSYVYNYPVVNYAPPSSVSDFLFDLPEDTSNSGYGFGVYPTPIKEKYIYYHGYKTFLDLSNLHIPSDSMCVHVYHDPDTIRTKEQQEIVESRKQEYGRVYTNLTQKLNQYMQTDFGFEADFRREIMDNDCVWLLKLHERNPIMCFMISFDIKRYIETFETSDDIARREWYLTFQKENTCHVSPCSNDMLKTLSFTPLKHGAAQYKLMLPNYDETRLYFVCEYYFVAHENLHAVDKRFLNTNTKNLGYDIIRGNINPYMPQDPPPTAKRKAEEISTTSTPTVDPMELDDGTMQNSSSSSSSAPVFLTGAKMVEKPKIHKYLPSTISFETNEEPEEKKEPKKKRGRKTKTETSEICSQLAANYFHIFTQLLGIETIGNVINLEEPNMLSDETPRTKDPNYSKKITLLRDHVSISVYYKVMGYISSDFVKEEMEKLKQPQENTQMHTIISDTVLNAVGTSFIMALTQKNHKKQQHTKNASAAWNKFIEDYLIKKDNFFLIEKGSPELIIASIFKSLYEVASHIYKNDYCFDIENMTSADCPTECTITKNKMTEAGNGRKLLLYKETDKTKGFKLCFVDEASLKIALSVIKSMYLWEEGIETLIKDHVKHNFMLFKSSQKDLPNEKVISAMFLEQQIVSFFTQYGLDQSSEQSVAVYMNCLNKAELQNVHTAIFKIPENQQFNSIEDLINLTVTVILESLKTFAIFKNILVKIFI